jgi:hypothetical protein
MVRLGVAGKCRSTVELHSPLDHERNVVACAQKLHDLLSLPLVVPSANGVAILFEAPVVTETKSTWRNLDLVVRRTGNPDSPI